MTHGAVRHHSGRPDTRAFREVAGLGAELKAVGDEVIGARTPAKVALLIDWDSWWAVEMADGPNRLVRYLPTVLEWGRALWEAGAQLDVVSVTAELSSYDVVVAPLLHMVKDGVAERLDEVVARGGSLVTGYLSGRVDADDRRFLDDVPGPLKGTLGIRVSETDSAEPDHSNPILFAEGPGADCGLTAAGRMIFEVIVPEGAEVVARYGEDFYAGEAAVTLNRRPAGDTRLAGVTEGQAWYIGTALDHRALSHIMRMVLARHDLVGPYADLPSVELSTRIAPSGIRFDFVINHSAEPVEVPV